MKRLTFPQPKKTQGGTPNNGAVLFMSHGKPTGSYGEKIATLAALMGALVIVGNEDAYTNLIENGLSKKQVTTFEPYDDQGLAAVGFSSAVMPIPAKIQLSARVAADSTEDVARLKQLRVPLVQLVVIDLSSAQQTASDISNTDLEGEERSVAVAKSIPSKSFGVALSAMHMGKMVISSEEDLDELISALKDEGFFTEEDRLDERTALHDTVNGNTWSIINEVTGNVNEPYAAMLEAAKQD